MIPVKISLCPRGLDAPQFLTLAFQVLPRVGEFITVDGWPDSFKVTSVEHKVRVGEPSAAGHFGEAYEISLDAE